MQAHDTRTIYEIPASNLKKFEEKIAKLSKRSVKLGCPEIKPFVFDRFKKPVDAEKPEGEQYLVYKVLFTVDTPKLNGWEFVARIDHANETGNIVRPIPNTPHTVPERYRSSKPFCEHCKVNRARRDTYIVCQEETGTFAQVGSTCLSDFLGHDAHKIARLAEWLGYADEVARGSQEWLGVADRRWVDVDLYLAHCASAVRRHGWVPRSACEGEVWRSTASVAMKNAYPYTQAECEFCETPESQDKAVAIEALEWAQSLSSLDRPLTEYEHNIGVIANAMMIEHRSTGLAASIVGVYLRNKGEAAARAALKSSKHFSKVGDRVRDIAATMTKMSPYEGTYGMTYFYIFTTDAGNVVKWAASKNLKITPGTRVILTGTVKKHSEYKEVKQTEMTRCSVTLPDAKAAA